VSVYSYVDQTVAPGQAITLELTSATTTTFDITNAGVNGEVVVLENGFYEINWGVDGLLTPPYPFPVPAWSFGIFVNGVLAPASTSGSFSISPDDLVTHNSAVFIVQLNAGDVLTLVNTSTSDVNALSTLNGSAVPVSAGRVNVVMLTDLGP